MKIRQAVSFRVRCCVLSMVALSTLAFSQPISPASVPAGWRLPDHSEVDQAWRRSNSTHYLIAHGDFNGDGRLDTAILLVRADGSGFAPFIALTRKAGATVFVQCETTNQMDYLETEGLQVAKRGTYRTVCGKGYRCEPGDKESVTISFDAIEFFKRDGPSRLIYWNAEKKAFSEVWLSD
jgi:hypothetical protein